eukprot:13773894-Heterocapsa_arctica.AAC.1
MKSSILTLSNAADQLPKAASSAIRIDPAAGRRCVMTCIPDAARGHLGSEMMMCLAIAQSALDDGCFVMKLQSLYIARTMFITCPVRMCWNTSSSP